MSRTISIALAAAIAMSAPSAFAGKDRPVAKDRGSADLLVGSRPSNEALMARKKTSAWKVLSLKNMQAWIQIVDRVESYNPDSGKRICATLDRRHAFCAGSYNGIDGDGAMVTVVELALYKSKGQGDIGEDLGPLQRVVCVNADPKEIATADPGECRDFDTGEDLDVYPPLAAAT